MASDVVLARPPVRIAASVTTVTLAAPYAYRAGMHIFNDSSAVLYVKYGPSATTTDYALQLWPGELWTMPDDMVYDGIVTGVWGTANGAAQVTELFES